MEEVLSHGKGKEMKTTRIEFIKLLGMASAGYSFGFSRVYGQERSSRTDRSIGPAIDMSLVPSYLRGYEALYHKDPKAAAIAWHRNAKWGLFVHYALASLRGLTADAALKSKNGANDDWKKLKQGTPEEFLRLKEHFTAEKFNADQITDLALAAEMKYVNFTTRHLGDLYMFRTSVSDFTSLNSPAKRDLVAELAEQCQKKGLGLFLYCPPDVARTEPQPVFDRNRTVIHELLTQYGPIAGIWLDGVGSYYEEPVAYRRIDELYALIRSLQPQCLISFKQGTGTEDFVAPEGWMHTKSDDIAQKAWAMNAGKRGDICTNMQTAPPAWIYIDGCQHINAEQSLALLADAFSQQANLTLNTGPLPDGSIHPDDVIALREAGERIRKSGFPEPKRMDKADRKKLKVKI
ncbi:MAG: alpha-L-fucosidase [Planctomycetota bacterium]|nr:alpha-L-fucosidase [Planctomycetota bacterium]